MHRSLVVGGVLGLGTAIVFGAAALAATMFPNGGTVNMSWGGGMMVEKGFAVPPGVAPAPMPIPVTIDDGTIVDEKGLIAEPDQP
jgi:hypothetical protein